MYYTSPHVGFFAECVIVFQIWWRWSCLSNVVISIVTEFYHIIEIRKFGAEEITSAESKFQFRQSLYKGNRFSFLRDFSFAFLSV